jgi:hypothetical protein
MRPRKVGTMLGMTSFFAYSLASEATYKHRGSSAVEALIRKHTVYLRYIVPSDQIASPTVIRGSVIPTRGVDSNRFSCENPGSVSVFNSMPMRIRIREAKSMQIHADPDPILLKFYIRNFRYFLKARQLNIRRDSSIF